MRKHIKGEFCGFSSLMRFSLPLLLAKYKPNCHLHPYPKPEASVEDTKVIFIFATKAVTNTGPRRTDDRF